MPKMYYAVAVAVVAALCGCVSQATQTNDAAVCDAFNAQRSHVEVVATGTVYRILGTRGGPNGSHEGYLMRLDGTCKASVKVETNVTLTGPVPLTTGESVVVKGEYEYTRLGGVIHWTHHDPAGRHEGGYVKAGNAIFQ